MADSGKQGSGQGSTDGSLAGGASALSGDASALVASSPVRKLRFEWHAGRTDHILLSINIIHASTSSLGFPTNPQLSSCVSARHCVVVVAHGLLWPSYSVIIIDQQTSILHPICSHAALHCKHPDSFWPCTLWETLTWCVLCVASMARSRRWCQCSVI